MTFITAIRSTAGIIVAADSLEVQIGAYLRWDEFMSLLSSKRASEDDLQALLSPKEVADLFKRERIKNIADAQKIFAAHPKALLLVAGKAELNGRSFSEIIGAAEATLAQEENPDAERIKQVVYEALKPELDQEDKAAVEQCEYILAVRDAGENYVYTMKYRDNVFNGNTSFTADDGGDQTRIVTLGGAPGAAYTTRMAFNTMRSCPSPTTAHEIAQALMSLAVISEKMTQEVPGVGGTIYYMFLHDKGYSYISSETEILNCLV
jgi:hypothetical protein